MRVLLLLLTLTFPFVANAAEPIVRVALKEDGQIVPGQQVHLLVDVLVPDFFTSAPELPLLDVPGALVTRSNERSQNLVQSIDGVDFSGIRSGYSIIPETDGRFDVPSFQISVSYTEDAVAKKATIATTPVSFAVGSTLAAAPTFAARALTITQEFDRDLSTLKAGDALLRTITVYAEDTQAMTMPPVEMAEVPGLRSYRRDPRIEDGVSVGREIGSRRTDTVAYVAEQSGTFALPPIAYPWFDVDAHLAATAMLPGAEVTFEPKVAAIGIPPVVEEQEPERDWSRTRSIGIFVAALVVAALLCVSAYALAHRRHDARPRQRSERRLLGDLRRTILSAPEPQVYDALMRWSARGGYRSLREWADDGSPELRREIDLLSRKLFRGEAVTFDRAVLAGRIASREPPRRISKQSALPPLNPAVDCR
ncbi:BatD family protein [Rhizobium sp. Root1220]|uniref:BatD family protein n=1 Tax=Rhizobium sp. Root1220 TaxID=1736432 RepID=UPI0006F9D17B|nr:BatD family protein [Rhizobium sp. Root1220]KQV81934.1 hypothetical protein ASC90_24475 [Rhizobium sp. Root1220]